MNGEYKKFVQRLLQELREATGLPAERLYFAEKGERFAENSDRIFAECASHGESREICGIYVEELFERYREGTPFDRIRRQVLEELRRVQSIDFRGGLQRLDGYDTAKEALFIRLLNGKRHAAELKNAVYQTLGEIAVVLYFKVTEADGCVTSLKIRREYLQRWGRSEAEVFREALENTARMASPRLYCWEKMLGGESYNGEAFLYASDEAGRAARPMDGADENIRRPADDALRLDALGVCLSTEQKTNGAAAIFLPGVAKRLSDLAGETDLYLAFTSVHEVMVHNTELTDAKDLQTVLVKTIKEATSEEDYLSACIYRYHRKENVFSCVCGDTAFPMLPADLLLPQK